MKIALDVREYSHTPAGMGNYSAGLAEALVRTGADGEYLLYGHRSYPAGSFGKNARHRVVGEGWRFGWRRTLWENLVLPMDLRRRGVDLFHATSHLVPPAWHGAALVVTVHDMTNFLFPEWYPARNNAYRRRMIRRGVRHARAVVAVSRSTARDIERLFPWAADRVRFIPQGVHSRFSPEPVGEGCTLPGICRDPFILFVGTLSPRKNVKRLIESFLLLLEDTHRKDLRLILAGMRGWMSDGVLSGAGDRVHHAGFVTGEVLAEMYRRAVLVCLPSLYEGFGLPVLEAMASGTPVLVSNRSSLPELAPDEACLVDPEDTEALAESMERLVNDNDLRRRVREAGLRKARDFTWEKSAEQTLRVYREVV